MPRARAACGQSELFAALPPGLVVRAEFVSAGEEGELIANAAQLDFKPFQFQGWEGKRETVSFGWLPTDGRSAARVGALDRTGRRAPLLDHLPQPRLLVTM